jgi:hypothetical protein
MWDKAAEGIEAGGSRFGFVISLPTRQSAIRGPS